MYPEMLYDGQKPKDPVTFAVYPFGKSNFVLYEDDGMTREYQGNAFAKTTVEVESPKSFDTPGTAVTIKVGPAKGAYKEMPTARSYGVDVHLAVKPASVQLNGKTLPSLEKKEEFANAAEGWFFDARDRRGIVHVKTKALALNAGFTLKVQS